MQVKAYARQDGLILSLVWLASMWLVIQRPESSWGSLLMLCTPFYIAWRLKTFRDKILDGLISFRRAFCFSCYIFLYSSIVFALGQYLYFRFLDNGKFLSLFRQAAAMLKTLYEQNNMSVENIDMGEKVLEMMSPMQLVLYFMMQNLMIGAVLSLLLALLYKKSKL